MRIEVLMSALRCVATQMFLHQKNRSLLVTFLHHTASSFLLAPFSQLPSELRLQLPTISCFWRNSWSNFPTFAKVQVVLVHLDRSYTKRKPPPSFVLFQNKKTKKRKEFGLSDRPHCFPFFLPLSSSSELRFLFMCGGIVRSDLLSWTLERRRQARRRTRSKKQ